VTGSLVLSLAESCFAPLLAVDREYPANQADTGQMLVWLLVAGLVIGVVAVTLLIANRIAYRWRYNSHPALFRGLCKLHGLDSASRRLLKRVVRFHRLRQPARVFVEPKWLDPANLDASFQPRAPELERLRNGLFNLRPAATENQ